MSRCKAVKEVQSPAGIGCQLPRESVSPQHPRSNDRSERTPEPHARRLRAASTRSFAVPKSCSKADASPVQLQVRPTM